MSYATLKALHVGSVVLSYALFVIRGVWMMRAPHRLAHPAVRVVPHVVDSVLLASALALAWMLAVSPLTADWLAAKLVGLAGYVILGTIALRRGRTRRARIAAWIAAQLVFAYIVAVALTRTPLPGTG